MQLKSFAPRRVYDWLMSLFWLTETDAAAPSLPAPVPLLLPQRLPESLPEEQPDRQYSYDKASIEEVGGFYFRGAILDRLDSYFRILRRFRFADPASYDLYSRIGATLMPERQLLGAGHFPAGWQDQHTRRTFGCAFMGEENQDDDFVPPRFIYFCKMTRPNAHVQPTHGTVYRISVYLDDDKGPDPYGFFKKHGYVAEFYISVADDGSCRLLKTLQEKSFTIYSKSKKKSARKFKLEPKTITLQRWDYPPSIRDMYNDCVKRKATTAETFEQYAINLFSITVWASEATLSGIRVNVTSENDLATFCIDQKRTAYFFKDREQVLTPKGKSARIFHIVKPHRRVAKDGSETFVKMHYRGLRDFTWNGYDVHITVPGLHHPLIEDFAAGAHDPDEIEPADRKRFVDTARVGQAFRKAIMR